MRTLRIRKNSLRFGAIGASWLIFAAQDRSGLAAQDSAAASKDSTDGLVAGTVFRVPGFMLPYAKVEIRLDAAEGEKPKVKFRRQTVDCNGVGEFAVRVPGEAAVYVVKASAPGYQPQTKKAQIDGPNERIDVNFELEPIRK
jgi:hypothetical protein